MSEQNTSLSELFMLTRAQHRLTLTDVAKHVTSISSISRYESNQQTLSNATFSKLMNQVGLARQDVNNLMYANQHLAFLEAHNQISELLVQGQFTAAETVASNYNQRANATGNQLANINTIELRAKIRRRRNGNYQLSREDQKTVVRYFERTHAQWTDHDYELYAHVATCIPLSTSFTIYQSISSLFRANKIAPGYITSLIFCTRNLLLKAIEEDDRTIIAYLREDFIRIKLTPTTSDVDVYFMAITRNLCIKLADFAMEPSATSKQAAARSIMLARKLLGAAVVSKPDLVFQLLVNRSIN
ncbi:MAG: hypothetical protein LKG24_01815 [Lacticaseibacillus songhuajiangensis]|jgi:transcriptional regulator with XRE-family HTH domain|nr:hypothetical protein [Lacticaseibacillus songhuajiangensis]